MKRSLVAVALLAGLGMPAQAQVSRAIRDNAGFNSKSVARNDDGSSGLESLGFTINLFGKLRSSAYVNNNGNITFDSALSTFTPFGLRRTEREIIAPFFADVDTRNVGSKLVTYGMDVVNGHRAFGVNYVDVGYYQQHIDKTNSFQLVLIERGDQGSGDFDIEFNYARIAWETGDASGGTGGLGGTPAAAGWSNGGDTSYELPGSLIPGAFLDGGPYSLVRQSLTGAVINTSSSTATARAGRLVFRARDGVISPGLVISGGQLPDATAGVPYSETLTVKGADPPFRWSLQADVVTPPGLSMSTSGVLAGTPTTPGIFSFTVGVTGNTEDGEVTVFERGSVTVRQAALRVTTSCPLPDAFVGSPYSQALGATGALGPIWSVRDPLSLPAGIGLSANGLLAGTPQAPGTYSLILEAKTGDGSAVPAQALCKLNVNPAAIRLTGGCALPHATVGVPFSQVLQPSGGFAPHTFELLGDLPQGVALIRDGLIAGTPRMWGVWIFKIATVDGRGASGIQDCSMIVDPARFTTSVCPLPSGVSGQPYSATLAGGFVWSLIGNLPGGLSLSPDGKITGTPMTAGGAQFQLLATNGQGQPSAESCSLIVERGPVSFAGCPLPGARVGDAYRATLLPGGGSAPYNFSTVAGTLPPGILLSTGGQVTGTPVTPGTYNFTLRLRDVTQASTLQACELKVVPAELQLSTPCPLPDGRVGENYSVSLQASGGTAPYQYSFGLLPDGLSGSSTGTISGRPALVGGRGFNIRITDAASRIANTLCSIAVGQPAPPAISLVDPPATVPAASTTTVLGVQLAAVYTAPIKGQIALDVKPETGGHDPVTNSSDPLLAFANGQRTAPFTIPAGATRVNIPLVSTGTVASTVGVSLSALEASGAPIAQNPITKFFRLVPAAPSVSSACYIKTLDDSGIQIDVRVTGITSTRALTKAQVTIPGTALIRPNIPVPAEFVFDASDTLNVEIAELATSYFSSAPSIRTGGAFTLTIPVRLDPLTPTNGLGSVTFQLFNGVGGSGTRPLPVCQ